MQENKDNVYYQDGIDAATVRKFVHAEHGLLIHEAKIKEILSSHPKIRVVEEGYYIYDDSNTDKGASENIEVSSEPESPPEESAYTPNPEDKKSLRIIIEQTSSGLSLKINERQYKLFEPSDALERICEYAIVRRPFIMARVASSTICINDQKLFLRQPAPASGYMKLTNGLQMLKVRSIDMTADAARLVLDECGLEHEVIVKKGVNLWRAKAK